MTHQLAFSNQKSSTPRGGIKKLVQKTFTAKTLAEGLEKARGIATIIPKP